MYVLPGHWFAWRYAGAHPVHLDGLIGFQGETRAIRLSSVWTAAGAWQSVILPVRLVLQRHAVVLAMLVLCALIEADWR